MEMSVAAAALIITLTASAEMCPHELVRSFVCQNDWEKKKRLLHALT